MQHLVGHRLRIAQGGFSTKVSASGQTHARDAVDVCSTLTPDDAAFRKFAQAWPGKQSFTRKGDVATLSGCGLSATLDLAKNKILKTEGAAVLAPNQPISVNGQDIWTPLLTGAQK